MAHPSQSSQSHSHTDDKSTFTSMLLPFSFCRIHQAHDQSQLHGFIPVAAPQLPSSDSQADKLYSSRCAIAQQLQVARPLLYSHCNGLLQLNSSSKIRTQTSLHHETPPIRARSMHSAQNKALHAIPPISNQLQSKICFAILFHQHIGPRHRTACN